MSRPRQHIVLQGEHVAKIAAAYGVTVDAVWDDPANHHLREAGRAPGLLAPGDVLTVPAPRAAALTLRAGAHNAFEAVVPTTRVRVRLLGDDGPLAGAAYVIEGLGRLREGVTDGEGFVEQEVPADVERLRVVLTEHDRVVPVLVGHLDPVTTASGVTQRLQHLGLVSEHDLREEAAREGVVALQRRAGLAPTGVVDEATRDVLRRAHGS